MGKSQSNHLGAQGTFNGFRVNPLNPTPPNPNPSNFDAKLLPATGHLETAAKFVRSTGRSPSTNKG